MGRWLYDNDQAFQQILDECDEALRDVLPERLISVLYGGDEDSGKWHA